MNPCCDVPAFESPKTSATGKLQTVVLIGPPNAGHKAHVLLDRHARVIGYLLAKAGQFVEKCGLSGVWRAD